MSFPRDFVDEVRARTSLAQLAGRRVVWDAKKSNPGKGDMWAPCPLHQESSASFHVDDQKGYFYCFGCRAKGDVFGFVRETENVGFIQALRILAHEAGMPMPEDKQRVETTLSCITCECSCGKISKVSADKLEPILGGKLTSTNALSLIPKLRCTVCQSSPSYIFDDKMKQLFGQSKHQR